MFFELEYANDGETTYANVLCKVFAQFGAGIVFWLESLIV